MKINPTDWYLKAKERTDKPALRTELAKLLLDASDDGERTLLFDIAEELELEMAAK